MTTPDGSGPPVMKPLKDNQDKTLTSVVLPQKVVDTVVDTVPQMLVVLADLAVVALIILVILEAAVSKQTPTLV